MASSTYYLAMSLFKERQDEYKAQYIWDNTLSLRKKTINSGIVLSGIECIKQLADAVHKSEYRNISIYEGSGHNCRETLLGSIRTMSGLLDQFTYRTPYSNYLPTVFYRKEKGSDLSIEHVQKVVNFFDRIKSVSLMFNFSVVDNNILAFTMKSKTFDFYLLSLLLYVCRKTEIIDYLIKKLDDEGKKMASLSEILIKMSYMFIENPSYGDSSNPAFQLSMYSYIASMGITPDNNNQGGPVYYLNNPKIIDAKVYLEKIYFPYYTNKYGNKATSEETISKSIGNAEISSYAKLLFKDFIQRNSKIEKELEIEEEEEEDHNDEYDEDDEDNW